MSTFSRPVRDLFIATGAATETTVGTFISTTTNGKVTVLKKDGTGAAAAGSDAYIVAKDLNGRVKSSDVLKVKQIKYVTKSDPVTVLPAYSFFDVSIANVNAGDIYEGLVRILNYGSQSAYDEYPAPFFHTFVAGDTVDTVAAGLIKSLSFQFSKAEGASSKYVNNITGYDKVFATKAAALAAKATLTNGTIIWIMEDNKAWIVADKTALTFATIATTEKTDWSAQITAGTAEYLNGNPWFYFVKAGGAVPRIYIIAKEQSMTNMKMQGYNVEFKVGLRLLDAVDFAENFSVAVTNVGRVSSPGEGKNIRRLENFTKGHTGDFYRGMAYPNNFETSYDSVVTTNYWVINVEFSQSEENVNSVSGDPSQKLLQIACADGTTATTLYNLLVALL